jgi:hypothetical protein
MILRRRDNPPKYADYGRYKTLLREDFQYCCGYCRSHESIFGSVRNMTIDHFRPKSLFPHLICEYGNLHYCCNECNTYKGDRWPTDAELIKGYRFVDACADDPNNHYEFLNFEIKARTPPGEFSVAILRLDRPALLARRRAAAARFDELVTLLHRTDRLLDNVKAAGNADADFDRDISAIRADLLDQLRGLIFPPALAD